MATLNLPPVVGSISAASLTLKPARVKVCVKTWFRFALGNRRQVDSLAKFKRVVVGDHDFGAIHLIEHFAGHEFPTGVVTVGIVRLEDT